MFSFIWYLSSSGGGCGDLSFSASTVPVSSTCSYQSSSGGRLTRTTEILRTVSRADCDRSALHTGQDRFLRAQESMQVEW